MFMNILTRHSNLSIEYQTFKFFILLPLKIIRLTSHAYHVAMKEKASSLVLLQCIATHLAFFYCK